MSLDQDKAPLAWGWMHVSLRLPGPTPPRLLEIDPAGTWRLPRAPNAPELGDGWWALPGLADAHAHLAADELNLDPGDPAAIARRAYACLEGGVFLVFDKGWNDDSVAMTLAGLPPSSRPDFEAAGRMVAVEGGYFPGFAVETDPAGLVRAVQAAVAAGRGWVKLVGDWPRRGRGAVANFDPATLRAAVETAHAGGARVAIHTMAPGVPSLAVAAGVDSIEHGLFLDTDDLEELAARGGVWVPTVLRMRATQAMLGVDSSGGRLIGDGLDNVAQLLAGAPEGLTVLAGTDLALPSSRVGAEAAALADLGLSPERAVEAVSGAARAYAGLGPGFTPGERADAVFFPADPRQSPEVLEAPVAVLRGGVRVR